MQAWSLSVTIGQSCLVTAYIVTVRETFFKNFENDRVFSQKQLKQVKPAFKLSLIYCAALYSNQPCPDDLTNLFYAEIYSCVFTKLKVLHSQKGKSGLELTVVVTRAAWPRSLMLLFLEISWNNPSMHVWEWFPPLLERLFESAVRTPNYTESYLETDYQKTMSYSLKFRIQRA